MTTIDPGKPLPSTLPPRSVATPLEKAAAVIGLSTPRRLMLAVGALALAAVLSAAWGWRDIITDRRDFLAGKRPLMAQTTWHYQLTNYNFDELNKLTADVFVVDYAIGGGRIPMTREQVAAMQKKPDGTRRTVISYMSIGEAEEFRYYWKADWKKNKPDWLGPENCAWPEAHAIRFWRDEWKDLSIRAADSYLKRIIDAGFDGVYLDRVDMYDFLSKENPRARTQMIDFVVELATNARRWKPGFFVLPQNAEDLLEDRRYRRAIDGLGKEELLYSGEETGARNNAGGIRRNLTDLRQLLWTYKPVFAVEYVLTRDAIRKAETELRSYGIVPTVQTRALDGKDPTAPPEELKKEIGTPERTQAECPKGTSW